MLKKTLLIATCLLVINISATTTQASPAFFVRYVVKKVVKQISKATGKNILNGRAPETCLLWNQFVCAPPAK